MWIPAFFAALQDDVDVALEFDSESQLGIGDPVPSEAWAPYIEFIPQRRAQYGR